MSQTIHTAIKNKFILEKSKEGMILFNNPTGESTDINGSHIKYGLCPGSSDLIGWRSVDIDGEQVAQFCAVEIKTLSYPSLTKKQANFLFQVLMAGGYSAVVMESEGENFKIILLWDITEYISDFLKSDKRSISMKRFLR